VLPFLVSEVAQSRRAGTGSNAESPHRERWRPDWEQDAFCKLLYHKELWTNHPAKLLQCPSMFIGFRESLSNLVFGGGADFDSEFRNIEGVIYSKRDSDYSVVLSVLRTL